MAHTSERSLNMLARLLVLTCLALGILDTTACGGEVSDLTVLYVGLDPEQPVPDKLVRYAGAHTERQRELFAERTPAFMAFLKEHFEKVGFVSGDDYEATLSNDYDVTIFDTQPKVLSEGAAGSHQRMRLPDGFDRPSIMIGEVGPFVLGRFGFGYKIDHL
jgi:hypothetical protein